MTSTASPEQTDHHDPVAPGRKSSRRAGYVVAAACNLLGLWIVNQLLDWGWPPFVTEDFRDLLPILDVSFAAGAALNLIWVVRDPGWARHGGQICLNVISFVAAVLTWRIFPFDFSAYSLPWETVARVVIVLCTVGLVAATITEIVALARHDGQTAPPTSSPSRGHAVPL